MHDQNDPIRKPVVVIYSGGMDSFTLLNRLLSEGNTVLPVSFHYGQRHARELECARQVCESLGLKHQIADIRAIQGLLGESALTSDTAVPEGHYADANMRATVVPNRNMVMLSLAISYAISQKAGAVAYGAHGGDHAIYPDCRPEFVERMRAVAAVSDYEPVDILTPYLNWDKTRILEEGLRLGLDYSQTWTCYNGRDKACGRCGSCVERLEAFAANGQTDPLPYETAAGADT